MRGRPPGAARRRPRRPARRGAGPARAGPGGGRRDHGVRHGRRPPRGRRRPRRAAARGRPRRRHGAPAAGGRHRHRPSARPDRSAGGLGRRPRPLGGRARRPRPPRGRWPTTPIPRCAGASPSSSPPRRWTATAGTGGRRTARPSWWRAWTTRRWTAGGSPTPPTRTQAPTEVAYPAAGTADADVSAWILRLDGSRARGRLGPRRVALPLRRRVGRPRAAGRAAPARPVGHRGARRRPGHRRHRACCSPTATRAWVERAPGHARAARRRPARDVLRRRRQPAPRRRRHPRDHASASTCGRSSHVGDDEVLFTANPVDDATGNLVWRWSAGGIEPLTTGSGVHTAVAGGSRSWCGRPRSTATAPPPPCSARPWAGAAARAGTTCRPCG